MIKTKHTDEFFQYLTEVGLINLVFRENQQQTIITPFGQQVQDYLNWQQEIPAIAKFEAELNETYENQKSDSENNYGNFDNPEAEKKYYEGKIWALCYCIDELKMKMEEKN